MYGDYFFSESRISRNSRISSEGSAGASSGAAFCSLLMPLITAKIAVAIIRKLITVLINRPIFRVTAPAAWAAARVA